MKYLVTIRNKEGKTVKSSVQNYGWTFGLVRKAILSLHPIEETSADLKALKVMSQVHEDRDKARAITNQENGVSLVVQIHINPETNQEGT